MVQSSNRSKKRFFIGVIDPTIETRLCEQFSSLGRVILLRDICRLDTQPDMRGKSDIVIISPCILRGALHGGWPTLKKFFDQAYIMAMVGSDDIRSHRDIFSVADGWIVGKTQIDNIRNVAGLVDGGYQALPSGAADPPDHDPISSEAIWSLSANEFGAMVGADRAIGVDGSKQNAFPNQQQSRARRAVAFKLPSLHGLKDLYEFGPYLRKSIEGWLQSLLRLSRDTEFSSLLSWIVRVEFGAVLAIALISGHGTVARILHSLTGHEQFLILITGCALSGWLLRIVSPHIRDIRSNGRIQ